MPASELDSINGEDVLMVPPIELDSTATAVVLVGDGTKRDVVPKELVSELDTILLAPLVELDCTVAVSLVGDGTTVVILTPILLDDIGVCEETEAAGVLRALEVELDGRDTI